MTDTAGHQPETTIGPAALAEMLGAWLPHQRWFAGKARTIAAIEPRLLGGLGGHSDVGVQLWLIDVSYADGERHTYQLPVAVGSDLGQDMGHAQIGEFGDTEGGVVHLYDAMWDRRATQAWLEGIATDRQDASVQFHLRADAESIPLGASSMVITGEQSNTSIVFGDKAIMKLFRRLDPGLNPDVEIHDALGHLGGRHIATLLGHVTATVSLDGVSPADEISLAMLQEYMSSATDGWKLAIISVRDLMAEADLHAEEAGGDFAGEAFRLGAATAEIHADLAEAFGTDLADRDAMRARADAMLARLEEAQRLVPQLDTVSEALRAKYEAFAASDPMVVHRVHGDLHLGQVLRTLKRWVVLDFEGEPVKTIESRRDLDSPLRDVAGMLRSFDYAANHQVIDSPSDNQRRYRAVEWADRNRTAFCQGYAHSAGADPRSAGVLLQAFEADKAVYEAVYEARNRPAWLPVPLASLGRLATASPQPR